MSKTDYLSEQLPDTTASDVPAALLPYQQAWIADDSQLKIAAKSRRIGLTWAEAADDALIAASARTGGGQNVYYIGYNMDMAIEFIEACAMWSRVFNYAASEVEEGEEVFAEGNDERSIKTFTIRFASGFRIVALSSRPANLRGKQGVVVIDEAAFHGQLDELIKAALALLIWGGRVRVISTHDGDGNAFNELVNEVRSGKRSGTVHRTTFREAVAEGLYQRVCLRLGTVWSAEAETEWVASVYAFYGDAASEELDVIPSQGSGAWLTSALIEARMRPWPVLRYTAPKGFELRPEAERFAVIQEWLELEVLPLLEALPLDCDHGLGADFARTGDLTVFAPFTITQTLKRRFPFLLELRNMPFRQQEQILNFICDRLPRLSAMALDGRGNGAALAEYAMQRYGSERVHIVMATETWYREEMPPLKEAFEDDTIELPRDADVLRDLRSVKVIHGTPRVPDARSDSKDGGQRHGDAAIAIALAHFASRNPGSPIEFTAAPHHPRGYDNSRDSGHRGRMRADDDSEDLNIPEQGAW